LEKATSPKRRTLKETEEKKTTHIPPNPNGKLANPLHKHRTSHLTLAIMRASRLDESLVWMTRPFLLLYYPFIADISLYDNGCGVVLLGVLLSWLLWCA
jgi:hypothetical protein